MIKDVCITIKSIQMAEGDEDTTELFTYGKFAPLSNGKGYRVTYEESEATGFEGSDVTLDITPDLVKMLRNGKAYSSLIIEKGKKHHCHYGTEYGDFMIGISADEIKSDINENGGNLYLKYTIDINSGLLSENEMFINIKECNTDLRS